MYSQHTSVQDNEDEERCKVEGDMCSVEGHV